MFFTLAEIANKLCKSEFIDFMIILAKVELNAKREILVELCNAIEENKEKEIPKEKLLEVLYEKISDLEEMKDYLSRNFLFDIKIAGKKPRITGFIGK